MKIENPSFLYKQKFNKKLKKTIYIDESNIIFSKKKNNPSNKRGSQIKTFTDIDQNLSKQNSVISRQEIEKSLLFIKNSLKALRTSFNKNINSEENSLLNNQIRESKENMPVNEFYRGQQTTKRKNIDSSINKNLNKRSIYNNNSCIKKINLKELHYYNNEIIGKHYLNTPISLGITISTNSNCKYLNNETKNKKKLKSFGVQPKNLLGKMSNINNPKNNINNKNAQKYNSQKYSLLNNNILYKNNFNSKDSKNKKDFSEDNIFIYNDEKQIELTKEEKALYGDRIMKGYSKIKLLGKGGYGIAWLCTNNLDSDDSEIKEYAVKQTSKKRIQESTHNLNNILINARNEIAVLFILNNINIENNNNNNQFSDSYNDSEHDNESCEIIPKIYDSYEDHNDIWFSFEKGGISLSNLCFKIKGEFEKGERIYLIQKGQFLENLFSNVNLFKYLLRQLVIGINYINSKNIIHSDIKPENILIDYIYKLNVFKINSVKIIDYGSSFLFNEISTSNTSNTPEYLCPEITIGNKIFIRDLSKNNKYISAVDIWSLGITFLELCLCCPIWMNYKAKIVMKGKNIYTHGIFGCRMRDSNKIYQKQLEVSKNLKKLLNNSLLYMFEKEDRDNFIDLLGKMLNIDYNKRITTLEILKHPFLDENIE